MKSFNVLFVGNSYTYFNDMPEELFAPIAREAGYSVTVRSLTRGDWDLIRSSNKDDVLGMLIDRELKENRYDYVVLQEQSTNPMLDRETFYDGVRAFLPKIRESGAVPLLYCTWGRKPGCDLLSENGLTSEAMAMKVAAAYEAIGAELGIEVAHVGKAFLNVYTSGGSEIYNEDMSHPSYSGSFLTALTLFAKLTGQSCASSDFTGELSSEEAAVLRRGADKAVFEKWEIPEEYRTVSEGVSLQG